jgi:hypothetical protein
MVVLMETGRCGGRSRTTGMIARAETRAGIRNSQREDSRVRMGPAVMVPAAPPTLITVDITTKAWGRRSAGRWSLTRAKQSGKTAPPRPCTTRPAIMTGRVVAIAEVRAPRLIAVRATSRMRRLP